ncbi:hypothetical protein DLE60_33650, partial [Micromonospora globispora]|uniref:cytochrome c-type biogenesis CcmF C-terminal domain-containing protein n=1 Tax=Micromonospora globispora TaxID=1450148 RepID=UPI000D8C22CC
TATLATAAVACLLLEVALLRHDFSIRFVAENGGRHVPLYYTVTSLWSALDGSLLLWLLVLGGYAALLARRRYPPRLHAYAMVVVSTVTLFFFALSRFAANPFREVSPAPADGPGPNPLLQQHPAMGVHPPLLYAGYIGLVVPFAFALAAPLAGREGRGWLRVTRPWTLVAWAALTAGIGLGAWWSYAVASVHAFTDSPLGPMLLGFVLLAVVASTVLTGWRSPEPPRHGSAPVLSRTTAVLVNGMLLVTIAAVVLIGTIFPLLSGPLGGARVAVGPGYYQRTAVPLAIVVLLVMGATPALRPGDRAQAVRRLLVPGAAALATVAAVGLLSRPGLPALTAFG